MKKVLVTGGSGYIGSHTIVDLIENGFEVISVDNFINSDSSTYQQIFNVTGKNITNYELDLCNLSATKRVFQDHPDIESVIHFAALKAVGDSVKEPILYFRNNINSLLNVLDCSMQADVKNFVFSSSCTVYGNAEKLPVTEVTPQKEAESPYGRTKQFGEKIIIDSLLNHKMNAVLLRYFNPAGAHPSTELGESPKNVPQNLVPVITETGIGKRKSLTVFGDDYETRDGSCLRDFIHVMDLARAHTLSINFSEKEERNGHVEVFNLGVGEGVTVLEAIKAFEKVSGQPLNYSIGGRREGDVVKIYSDLKKASTILGWSPKYSIEDIMESAWKWELKRQH